MKRNLLIKGVVLCLSLCGLFADVLSQMIVEDWQTTLGSQEFYIRSSSISDNSGNLLICGSTINSNGNYDILAAKYGPDGEMLWISQYNGTGNGDDFATNVVVDGTGNVFVTGGAFSSFNDSVDVVTLMYDSLGNLVWDRIYSGGEGRSDWGSDICVFGNGIFVGGSSVEDTTGRDFLAICYDYSGNDEWVARYDGFGSDDMVTRITVSDEGVLVAGASEVGLLTWDLLAVLFDRGNGSLKGFDYSTGSTLGFERISSVDRDDNGNFYLLGSVNNASSGSDIRIVKVDSNMNSLWTVDYSSPGQLDDGGTCVLVDDQGNVYVGGFRSSLGQRTDFITIKYNSSGALQWTSFFNGVADSSDTLNAMVFDGLGNLVVCGTTYDSDGANVAIISYDPSNGSELWSQIFNNKFNSDDFSMDLASTSDGGVVVSGQFLRPDSLMSFFAVKYEMVNWIVPADSDSISSGMRWVENRDQLVDFEGNLVNRVRYYSCNSYPVTTVQDDTLSLVFSNIDSDTTTFDTISKVDISFLGSNTDKKVYAIKKDVGWFNYYLGHIPEGRPKIPLWAKLFEPSVWNGVDVIYGSDNSGLKLYFSVGSGGEPGAIQLFFSGYESINIGANGELNLETLAGSIQFESPEVFEMNSIGEVSPLTWHPVFALQNGVVSFDDLGGWDPSNTLLISISLKSYYISSTAAGNIRWGTFFGGGDDDGATDLAIGFNGDIFPCGWTHSFDFPVRSNTFPKSNAFDGFVGRFTGDAGHLWSTFIGGNASDASTACALNPSNTDLFLAGNTESSDLPVSINGPFVQSNIGGLSDGFLMRFNVLAGTLAWSTYFGGDGIDGLRSLKMDGSGANLYIGGFTSSSDHESSCGSGGGLTQGKFPLCDQGNGAYFQDDFFGSNEGFIAKISLSHAGLVWSTYFGGNNSGTSVGLDFNGVWDIEIDPISGELYICGETSTTTGASSSTSPCQANSSGDFPVCNDGGYFQSSFTSGSTGRSGYLAQFSYPYHILEWSTFFGSGTFLEDIFVGDNSNIFGIGGMDGSANKNFSCNPAGNDQFPICNYNGNSYVQSATSDNDAILIRIGASHELLWATTFGLFGSNEAVSNPFTVPSLNRVDAGRSLAGDLKGNIYATGTIAVTPYVSVGFSPYQQFSSWFDRYYFGNYNEPNTNSDSFLAGFRSDNSLFWSTIFGGSTYTSGFGGYGSDGSEGVTNLKVDNMNDRLYLVGTSQTPFTQLAPCPGSGPNYFCRTLSQTWARNSDGFWSQFEIYDSPLIGLDDSLSNSFDMFRIFPNPTSGEFVIQNFAIGGDDCYMEIHDLFGRVVYSKKLSNNTDLVGTINIEDQPNGIYFVSVSIGDGKYCKKIVKQ